MDAMSKDETDLYVAFGQALSSWAYVEWLHCELFRIVAGGHAGNAPLAKAYWAIVSFDGKHRMVNAALTEALSKHPTYLNRWKGLNNRLHALSKARNRLAHAQMVRYTDEKGGDAVAMVTAVYSTQIDEGNRMSLTRVTEIERSFDKLATDLLAFQETFVVDQLMRAGEPMPRFKYPAEGALVRRVGYHYSDTRYEVGDVIPPYDNMPRLDKSSHAVEDLIRSAHPDGTRFRSKAVYLWDDYERAKQLWATAGRARKARKYFYTVEYDDVDLLHKGDLNHYTDAREFEDAGARGAAAASYWAGELHEKEPPRVELLVRSATVVAAEEYSAPPPEPWTDDDLPFLNPT